MVADLKTFKVKWLPRLILFLLSILYIGEGASLAIDSPGNLELKVLKAYYVSNLGNDANSGTSESEAWLTIDKVNRFKLEPGDRVLFRRGDVWKESLLITSSGTAKKPILFGSFGESENKPIIDAVGMKHGIRIDNARFVTIAGISVEGASLSGIYLDHSSGKMQGVSIVRCEIRNTVRGIWIYCGRNGTIFGGSDIRENLIADVTKHAIDVDVGDKGDQHTGVLESINIEANTILRPGGVGIQVEPAEKFSKAKIYGVDINNNFIKNSAEPAIRVVRLKSHSTCYIRNNRVMNAGFGRKFKTNAIRLAACDGTIVEFNEVSGTLSNYTGDGNAVILDNNGPDTYTVNAVVRYNFMHDNHSGNGTGVSIFDAKDCLVYYNVLVNNIRGIKLANPTSTGNICYNNTIVGSKNIGIYRGGDGIFIHLEAPLIKLYNNLIYACEGFGIYKASDSAVPVESHNSIYACERGSSNDFELSTTTITVNPEFAYTGSGKYYLKGTSALIDSGVGKTFFVNLDFNGKSIKTAFRDIGAFESSDNGL